eukprot:6978384-Pyramimonas_sp.AAC.2
MGGAIGCVTVRRSPLGVTDVRGLGAKRYSPLSSCSRKSLLPPLVYLVINVYTSRVLDAYKNSINPSEH